MIPFCFPCECGRPLLAQRRDCGKVVQCRVCGRFHGPFEPRPSDPAKTGRRLYSDGSEEPRWKLPKVKNRISIRMAMVAVAIAAVASAGIKLVSELRYRTRHGWNTSVLAIGERVESILDIRDGPLVLAAGTPCIVVDDPPDEDSAYPRRMVTVQVIAGQQRRTIIDVERIQLRVR